LKSATIYATIYDIILFALLLILSLFGMVYVYGGSANQGDRVVIEVNNIQADDLSIETDKIITQGNMIIEIKGKKVRVKDADCPNKLCVKQGWIVSGSIICLPNKVVIMIKKNIENSIKTDAVSG
jgi:hypothetical protein